MHLRSFLVCPPHRFVPDRTSGFCSQDVLVIQTTILRQSRASAVQSGNRTAEFCCRRARMVECFLLLRQGDAKWVPLVAIPAVLAGGVAAICLILSGIKGIIVQRYGTKRGGARPATPDRVVQWMARRATRPKRAGSSEVLTGRNAYSAKSFAAPRAKTLPLPARRSGR